MRADAEPPLSAEEVILTYRAVLGRLPENHDIIEAHRRAHGSVEAFAAAVLGSEEFREQVLPAALRPLPVPLPANDVQTRLDPASLPGLLERACAARQHEGPDMDVSQRVALLDALLARLGRLPESIGHCVEHGCGEGRLIPHLAARFGRVTGLDASRVSLATAAAALNAQGITRAALAQVTAEALFPAADCDLWLCLGGMRFHPPPLAMVVLEAALDALNPGGLAVFDLPVWIADYRFSTAGDPATPAGGETHALPQPVIFALADAMGCVPRLLRETPPPGGQAGRMLVNLFVLEKRR